MSDNRQPEEPKMTSENKPQELTEQDLSKVAGGLKIEGIDGESKDDNFKTQLSEEALSKVTGGGTAKQTTTTSKDTLPTEQVTLNYGKVEW